VTTREAKARWDTPWSPAQIHPDIAPLVSRPYLVIPFSEGGRRPFDYARRRAPTQTGTPTWAKTTLGLGAAFANPSISAPTDYYLYPSSSYPANSAAALPHSIAILWQRANTTNNGYPFLISSGGSGVFFTGDSSGFSVVHGGVIGFTALTTFASAANNLYLQLYSYDLVTMNHLVYDTVRGRTMSQAIAETRALSGSLSPAVAFKGSNEALQGVVAGVAWVRGAWTMAEMLLLAQMPTAIWTPYKPKVRPLSRIAYVPPAGGGGTLYTHTMSGGLQSSGAAGVSLRKTIVAAGGLQSGGAASVSARKVTAMTGGFVAGGVAAARQVKVVTMSGGLASGGAATIRRVLAWRMLGGLQSSGAASVTFIGVQTFTHTMSGGLHSSGAAGVSLRKAIVASGGLTTGGAAAVRRVLAVRMLGGVQTGGSVALLTRRTIVGVGGLQTGGAAATQFIFRGRDSVDTERKRDHVPIVDRQRVDDHGARRACEFDTTLRGDRWHRLAKS
jgi:hypothetical protein